MFGGKHNRNDYSDEEEEEEDSYTEDSDIKPAKNGPAKGKAIPWGLSPAKPKAGNPPPAKGPAAAPKKGPIFSGKAFAKKGDLDDDSDDDSYSEESYSSSSEPLQPTKQVKNKVAAKPVVQKQQAAAAKQAEKPKEVKEQKAAEDAYAHEVKKEAGGMHYTVKNGRLGGYTYRGKPVDFPPWSADGPKIMIIIDSNYAGKSKEEYDYCEEMIKKIAEEVEKGKRPQSDKTIYVASEDDEVIFKVLTKNIRVLQTYNGHPDKLRFVSNSYRAETGAPRNDPTTAGMNFITYLRESLNLEDAPIMIYYWSSKFAQDWHNPGAGVYSIREAEVAHPFIIAGVLPKSK